MKNDCQSVNTMGGPADVVGDYLMALEQVAEAVCQSTRNVWRLVARKEFPQPVKIGRSSRWYRSDVDKYLQELKQQRED